MKELLAICAALKSQKCPNLALATVIRVEGSAYRRPGARMLIADDGESWGMISGGCLEHDVLTHARGVIKSGVPTTVRYDSTSDDDILFGTGLGCNGIIDVFVEPVTDRLRESFIEAVQRCERERQPGAIATVVSGEMWVGSEIVTPLLARPIQESEEGVVLSMNAFGDNVEVFVQPLLPPVQLVIFGGWLDVSPLLRIARELGFQTIVVDSRRRPSSRRFFEEASSVLLCSPVEALSQIRFDSRTVAILMNHNFESDQEALASLTQAAVPYVGMLGPKRRQEKILKAVQSDGIEISEEFAAGLHGPAGLDIGAKTPEQIALSIVAEILAVLNGRNARPIRERLTPLHVAAPAPAYA